MDFSLVDLLDVHACGMLHFMMRKYFDIVGTSFFFFDMLMQTEMLGNT